MPRRITAEARFWKRVKKTKSCWIWGDLESLPNNYGLIKVGGVQQKAHRFSWQLHFGKIPKGMNVCHRCDNPPCVRPEHLFLGTQKDNMRDCAKKNRANGAAKSKPGEQNPRAKLTWEIVDHIRSTDEGSVFLARKLGVHYVTICAIRRGKLWPLDKHP